jgi:uncharacterized protein YdiU (UPF0061 family)
VENLLALMHQSRCDFTNSFRQLADIPADANAPLPPNGLRDQMLDIAAFDEWLADYRARLQAEGNRDDQARATAMNRANPLYVLRNHLAQKAIELAQAGDMSEIDRLYRLLSRPFEAQPGMEAYAAPPPEGSHPVEVSCSS